MAMDHKEIFLQDMKMCEGPLTHVAEGVDEPSLKEVDELFGAADVLSIRNAVKHRRTLLLMAGAGTLLTLAFLLYDEVELHGLILACGVMILSLFIIRRASDRLECHRKYLEYRVLAESLRLQYFLAVAGLGEKVSDLLPWTIKMDIPWITDILAQLPAGQPERKRSVLDCWIRDQKSYHEKALVKAEKKNRRDGKIEKAAVIITVAAYCVALVFELVVFRNANIANEGTVRAVLKILLGLLSIVTLFTGSYYGKMSLPNVIDDHRRMAALYEKAEEDVIQGGETRGTLLPLAREFLNENSTWYAYQSKNDSDIVL